MNLGVATTLFSILSVKGRCILAGAKFGRVVMLGGEVDCGKHSWKLCGEGRRIDAGAFRVE